MVDDSHHRYVGGAPLDAAGRMGVTVRVVPVPSARHGTVLDLGYIAWAG